MYSNFICILTLSWKDVPVLVLSVRDFLDFLVRYRYRQGDTEARISFFVNCRSSIVYLLYYLHLLAMCHEWIMMWSFYIDCRSVLYSPLSTSHDVWILTGSWYEHNGGCQKWNMAFSPFFESHFLVVFLSLKL